MGRLDKTGFLNNSLISQGKKDAMLRKLLLGKGDKSRTILLRAFQPVIENIADQFAQMAGVNYPILPQATASFVKVINKTGDLLRKHNGNIEVVGLASYVEKQLWLAMCKWYEEAHGFSTKNASGSRKYRKH